MSNEEIIGKLQAAIDSSGGFGKSVKFDFGDDGIVLLNDTTVSGDDMPTDCVIKVSKDDFIALSTKGLDPMMAFMSGKIKVEGDMSVAMQLQTLFNSM